MGKHATCSKLKNRVMWLVTVCIVSQRFSTSINAMYFVHERGFSLNEKIRLHCAVAQPSAGDMIKCVILCFKDDSCIAVSMDQLSQCFHYHNCPALEFPSRLEDNGHVFAVKSPEAFPCLHGGVWNQARGRCNCKYGFIGEYCDAMAQSCRDLNYDGYETGYHFANINQHGSGRLPFWGVCDVYQNRFPSYTVVGFNPRNNIGDKVYSDYVNGYGNTTSDWWLGLEKLLELNQAGFQVLTQHIRVYLSNSGSETMSFTIRSNVTITKDHQDRFLVTEHWWQAANGGDTKGNFVETCFGQLKNIPFSASDFDNDGIENRNCAAEIGNGWWYRNCDPDCNFLASSMANIKVPGVGIEALSPASVRIVLQWETPR